LSGVIDPAQADDPGRSADGSACNGRACSGCARNATTDAGRSTKRTASGRAASGCVQPSSNTSKATCNNTGIEAGCGSTSTGAQAIAGWG